MTCFINCRDTNRATVSTMADYMEAHGLKDAILYAVVNYNVDLQWAEFDDEGNRIQKYNRFGHLLPIVVNEYQLIDDIENSNPAFITEDHEQAFAALNGSVSERMANSGNWWQFGVAVVSSHITWDEEEECFVVPEDDVCTTIVAPLKAEKEEDDEEDDDTEGDA